MKFLQKWRLKRRVVKCKKLTLKAARCLVNGHGEVGKQAHRKIMEAYALLSESET